MFENKRVLVSGATGLIGSHLVKKLISEKAIVTVLGRSEQKIKSVFYNYLECSNFFYVVGNIAESMPEVGKIDYIFHAASPVSGAEIRSNPVDTISANIDGTRWCLEYLRKQGFGRMILFSSATVYGNQLLEETSYAEEQTSQADAIHSANTPYSEAKRMIEVMSRAYHNQYNVDSVIVRIGYVYGYVNPKPNTAFYEFISKAISGNDIVMNHSGMGRRDNIHVKDVVEGILIVAQQGITGESYNLSSNGELDNFMAIDEIAEMIVRETNLLNHNGNIKLILHPFEGKRNPGMKLNNQKAKDLGWSVNVSLEDGILDTIRKYMEAERELINE